MSLKNITLEEKLSRIKRGASVSPAASKAAFERFCAEPVIPALEEQYAFFTRTKLNIFLRENRIRTGGPVTFSDCASIIASHYDDSEKQPLNIRAVIDAFCYPLDEVCSFEVSERRRSRTFVRRKSIPRHLDKFYDFMIIPLEDLYLIAKEKKLPARSEMFRSTTARLRGYTPGMRLMDLYCEIKNNIDPSFEDSLGIYYERNAYVTDLDVSISKLRPLIEFFVVQAAEGRVY